jgi:hypothetical protein
METHRMNLHTPRAADAQEFPNLPQGTPPELVRAIKCAVYDALDHHGLAAFMMPREAALAHEAGHAIVATHEGVTIRRVTIFSRSMSGVACWGGQCMDAGGTWTTGPDSSADDDLRRARMIIAGLAGEALTGLDRPGSSIDELALSQLVGLNAAFKLDCEAAAFDDLNRSDAEYSAYAQRLWHEQVWDVTLAILRANREPFFQIVKHLHEKEKVQGPKLRQALAQVRRISS